MKKILYITNIPSPYRTVFFNMLGKRYDLTVWYEDRKEPPSEKRDKSWENDDARFYRACYKYKLKNVRNYDLVIICGTSTIKEIQAVLYMKLHKIPYCIEVDGGYPKNDLPVKYYIKKKLMSGAMAYLSTAKMTDSYLLRYGAEKNVIYRTRFSSVPNESVVHHCLTPESKEKLKEKLNLKSGFTVLYVGRFLELKGIDVLFSAVSGLNDINVLLIGGTLPSFLQKSVEENNIKNLTVIDFVEPRYLKDYYQAADILVFPSRDDVWGLVVNEALANGLPVISSTRSIAGLELIDSETDGYVFPVDDVAGLRDCILKYKGQDSEAKITMGENAIKKARQHTIETMVEDHVSIFEDLLNKVSLPLLPTKNKC